MVCQSLGHVWIHGLPTPSLLPRLIHARELTVEILVFIYLRHSCFTHVHMSLDTPLAPFPFSSSFLTVYDFLGFVFKAVAWCVCVRVCARAHARPPTSVSCICAWLERQDVFRVCIRRSERDWHSRAREQLRGFVPHP